MNLTPTPAELDEMRVSGKLRIAPDAPGFEAMAGAALAESGLAIVSPDAAADLAVLLAREGSGTRILIDLGTGTPRMDPESVAEVVRARYGHFLDREVRGS